jgi:alanyl-tRNA synthetase
MRFFVAKVDTKLRADTKNHSATHLMHQALAALGTHVEQKDR